MYGYTLEDMVSQGRFSPTGVRRPWILIWRLTFELGLPVSFPALITIIPPSAQPNSNGVLYYISLSAVVFFSLLYENISYGCR